MVSLSLVLKVQYVKYSTYEVSFIGISLINGKRVQRKRKKHLQVAVAHCTTTVVGIFQGKTAEIKSHF